MARKSEERGLTVSVDDTFVRDIRKIILDAKNSAIRSVDFERVMMYWRVGERIFVEEQHGKDRAEYGTYIIKNLSQQIMPEFGSGFSVRVLEQSRQFYRTYPIANALRSQLGWISYRSLSRISDPDKREYTIIDPIYVMRIRDDEGIVPYNKICN
ncbi:MAG: DUF1016 N-terminal domain-containing protein [Clostridiales bacterium]|jgi:hypothetical protein|nr:DUF1016 N-terminal domain-containing protein [Clostridiales bacterium]